MALLTACANSTNSGSGSGSGWGLNILDSSGSMESGSNSMESSGSDSMESSGSESMEFSGSDSMESGSGMINEICESVEAYVEYAKACAQPVRRHLKLYMLYGSEVYAGNDSSSEIDTSGSMEDLAEESGDEWWVSEGESGWYADELDICG